jgi:hypothetical protein
MSRWGRSLLDRVLGQENAARLLPQAARGTHSICSASTQVLAFVAMTAEDEIIRVIRGFYEPNGFHVARIEPSPEEKRPDAEIKGLGERALVEIKTKWDDEDEEERRLIAFDRHEVYFRQTPILPSNTHSGIVRDATRQLNAVPADARHFRMAWVRFDGPFAISNRTRFRATLYGIRRLADLGAGKSYECHDFDDSPFYRWKESLDAVALETSGELHLCLNDFSPRYPTFKASKIAGVLRGGINDPVELEQKGIVLRVGSSADRTSDETMLDYLRRHYDLPDVHLFDMTETVAEISIPDTGAAIRPAPTS